MHRSLLPIAVALLSIGDVAPASDTLQPRRPLPDLGRGIATVAKDAWAFATIPTRITREQAITAGGVLAVAGALYAFDPEIDRMFDRNRTEPFFDETRRIGEEFGKWGLQGPTLQYFVGMIGVGYLADQPRILRAGAEVIQARYMLMGLRGLIVMGFGRSRPTDDLGAYHFESFGGTSLPSGHATNVWSAAEVLRLHVDRWWATVPLYTIATCVSLQRIHGDAHWASDVWIGSVLGIASARFVYARHEDPAGGRARVLPTVTPDGQPALGYVRSF